MELDRNYTQPACTTWHDLPLELQAMIIEFAAGTPYKLDAICATYKLCYYNKAHPNVRLVCRWWMQTVDSSRRYISIPKRLVPLTKFTTFYTSQRFQRLRWLDARLDTQNCYKTWSALVNNFRAQLTHCRVSVANPPPVRTDTIVALLSALPRLECLELYLRPNCCLSAIITIDCVSSFRSLRCIHVRNLFIQFDWKGKSGRVVSYNISDLSNGSWRTETGKLGNIETNAKVKK